ncbi:MAG: alpha/beta hydrolase [Gammaproteobacteria bacterium]|nr:alpha/beta hydrolase [Gammaproteobacteria bacterium]MDE0453391.1 alpha/beta hydrolase [Gammaproteobacteria bacterium]
MAYFTRGDVSIHYEIHGDGFPVLLIAPGGMRSAIEFWADGPFNPIETLSEHFRVIAMDQRNAGSSTAPVSASDGWHTYTADQIGLLDHLGVERAHLMGACIGGPYVLGIIQSAPGRVASAVLQQSIGYDGDREIFYAMFQGWADAIADQHPEADEAAWRSFRSNMYDGDFDFNVGQDFVRTVSTPLLVLMGDDAYHPQAISRAIAAAAPNAQLVENWKSPEDGAAARVTGFLQAHTP